MSAAATVETPAAARKAAETINVRQAQLDTLLNLTGEMIINNARLSQVQKELEQCFALRRAIGKPSVTMTQITAVNAQKIAGHLQDLVMEMRTVPVSQLFQRFPRVIRDLARKTGKKIDLHLLGEETQVDRTVIEKLGDALVHQLRNSADHGIEPAEERLRAGKPEAGTITLEAFARDKQVFLRTRDDGRGMDVERIRAKAVERGLVADAVSRTLPVKDVLKFIFEPGFSTAAVVTDTSGRGVGMDVVRTAVESLGGSVDVESQPGQGTTITYRLPKITAVNIIEALVVGAGGEQFAIPIVNVIEALDVAADQLGGVMESHRILRYRDHVIPVVTLADVLGLQREAPVAERERHSLVILQEGRTMIAVAVDEMRNLQKVVSIALDDYFSGQLRGIAGTTILNGEEVGLILHVGDLVDKVAGKAAVKPDAAPAAARTAAAPPAAAPAPSADASMIDRILAGLDTSAPAVSSPGELDAAQLAAIAELQGASSTPAAAAPAAVAAASLDDIPEWIGLPDEGPRENAADPELIADFLREIKENLSRLGGELVILEREPDNAELINSIFRAFHSIKGAVNMIGFLDVGYMTHAAESVLDDVRKGEETITPEIIDVLLESLKELETCAAEIEQHQSATVKAPGLMLNLAKIRARREARLARRGRDVAAMPFTATPLTDLLQWGLRSKGMSLYEVLVQLGASHKDDGALAMRVLRGLFETGVVVNVVPDLAEIEAAAFGGTLKVMLASAEPLDALERRMDAQVQALGYESARVYPATA